jgi:hypothetical protein
MPAAATGPSRAWEAAGPACTGPVVNQILGSMQLIVLVSQKSFEESSV